MGDLHNNMADYSIFIPKNFMTNIQQGHLELFLGGLEKQQITVRN